VGLEGEEGWPRRQPRKRCTRLMAAEGVLREYRGSGKPPPGSGEEGPGELETVWWRLPQGACVRGMRARNACAECVCGMRVRNACARGASGGGR
jgi:hypothetical protein